MSISNIFKQNLIIFAVFLTTISCVKDTSIETTYIVPTTLPKTVEEQTAQPSVVSGEATNEPVFQNEQREILEGPLILFRIQNGESYLSLFDVSTLKSREIKSSPDGIRSFEWLENGCLIYSSGNVLNLDGQLVEKLNDEAAGNGHFNVSKVSPNLDFGARQIFNGFHEDIELEFNTLEILNRQDAELSWKLSSNGGGYGYSWSPTGEWLAFTDFDDDSILQIYRISPYSGEVEQLTNHKQDPGVIDIIKWSPNGNFIAYAGQAYLSHQNAEGGLVSIISILGDKHIELEPFALMHTLDLWWDSTEGKILVVGNHLQADENPVLVTKIHWFDASTGNMLQSSDDFNLPSNEILLAAPLGSLNTIFIGLRNGYFLLDSKNGNIEKIIDQFSFDGLIRDYGVSPHNFQGEESCN